MISSKDETLLNVSMESIPDLSFKILVKEKQTLSSLDKVKMTIKNNLSNEAEQIVFSNAEGIFIKPLEGNKISDRISYNITFEKDGHLTKTVTYNQLLEKSKENIVEVMLEKIEVGLDLAKLINLKPIYFDKGKFTIRPDAAIELDKVVKIMNENPSMEIELGSHTDCRGSSVSNELLSNKRAIASSEYIKKRISQPERIYGKGYGESKLMNLCACEGSITSSCKEEEHQLNRRTEFILKKVK